MNYKEKLDIVENNGNIVQNGKVLEQEGCNFITKDTRISVNKQKSTVTFTNLYKDGSVRRATVHLRSKKNG